MSTSPRRIEDFLPTTTPTSEEDPNSPKFHGHLLEMPLTKGGKALIDPDEVVSISPHRNDDKVTVIRLRDDKYTYFIDRPYAVVSSWVSSELED